MIKKTNNSRQDLQDKIKSALEMKNNHPKALNVSALNQILMPNLTTKTINSKNTRPNKINLVESARSKNAHETALNFAGNEGNIYVVFGGVGDLVLVLAECYKDASAKLIFFANMNSRDFGEQILKFFKTNYIILPNLMGTAAAPQIVQQFRDTGRLKNSAHLADNLDFNDWGRDTYKYKKRITLFADWKRDIGIAPNIKKVMIICPSGSFKDPSRQRYLLHDEYLALVHTNIRNGYMVYTTGSDKDFSYYPFINNTNHAWLLSNKIIDFKKNVTNHSIEKFLKIINSAEEVISMDTWLKTYSCLINTPTKVIMNRRHGEYLNLFSDPSDYIFLNKDLWASLEIVKFDDLLK